MHSTSHLRRDNTNTTVHQDKIIVNSHATQDKNKDYKYIQHKKSFRYYYTREVPFMENTPRDMANIGKECRLAFVYTL